MNLIGYKCKNITGFSRIELSEYLKRSKIFFLTSLTEASGSRILLEAISCGCMPVVFEECSTAVEVINEHKFGLKIKSRFKLKMPEKIVNYNFLDFVRIFIKLLFIRLSFKNKKSPYILDKYLIKNEINELTKLINSL
tara:strand:- start:132 stop:545 length:414 start_codon:yes stop_codon:yes gene_type:complete